MDPARDDARRTIEQLRARQFEYIGLLTGDNKRTASAIAEQLGVDEVRAELLPGDKAAHVVELLREYGHVAMIGDGVNDAQALSTASLGISMGHQGADIARETADVVLMTNDLSRVVFLVDHARRTLRIIQQNIGFALATKVLFLAAAMGGVATLWMAVAADMGATFAVTLNGLRLLRSRPHQHK